MEFFGFAKKNLIFRCRYDQGGQKSGIEGKNFIWETFYLKTRKVATFLIPRKLYMFKNANPRIANELK